MTRAVRSRGPKPALALVAVAAAAGLALLVGLSGRADVEPHGGLCPLPHEDHGDCEGHP
jgi:hypothetical protein